MPDLRADVAVIGGGPGGAATALELARGGARVVLVDRARFPRDKVCGDGLLPDAWRALERLGLAPAVAAISHQTRGIAFRAPGGREGSVSVPTRVSRRIDLDGLLFTAAREAGVETVEGTTLVEMSGDRGHGRWRAARFRGPRSELEVAAEWFVLATGAAPRPRALVGFRTGGRLGGAVRAYATGLDCDEDALVIRFGGELPTGYSWAFPAGHGVWNVGCGSFAGGTAGNLVESAERFAASFGATLSERPRGAPLATWFPRYRVAYGNVLAVGDAAGLTRPFSGEGIGAALVSGELAAACVLEAGEVARSYRRRLRRRFAREFAAWRLGERLLGHPRVVGAIVGRVEGSRRARERIKAVLGDTAPTGSVLSPLGLVRILLRR